MFGKIGPWQIALIAFLFIVLPILIVFFRSVRRGYKGGSKNQEKTKHIAKTTEIKIKEVIKVRCPYCQSLADVDVKKCPNCNANIN